MGYGSPFQSMAQGRLGTRLAPDLDCPVSIPGRPARTLRPKQKTTPSKPNRFGFERVINQDFALSRRPYFESQWGYLTTKTVAFNRDGPKTHGKKVNSRAVDLQQGQVSHASPRGSSLGENREDGVTAPLSGPPPPYPPAFAPYSGCAR